MKSTLKPKLSNSRALRIVAAAREEFSRRGFDGARMDQIARRAAVNKQLLFYYFHSKRGLFTAVLARGAAELEQALAELPTGGERPLDRIRLALDAQFDFLAAHPDLVALLTSRREVSDPWTVSGSPSTPNSISWRRIQTSWRCSHKPAGPMRGPSRPPSSGWSCCS